MSFYQDTSPKCTLTLKDTNGDRSYGIDMKHSIYIPDWVWEYWQDESGLKNPARAIRDQIILLTQRHDIDALEKEKALLPGSINEDIDFDVDDTPTLITLERFGICNECRKLMKTGEQGLWYTSSRGRKRLVHAECWTED